MSGDLEISDPVVLAELDLLFAQDSTVDVGNDARWNCFAKSYATMWLLRLLGTSADWYQGKLAILNFGAATKELFVIVPHAWAGTSPRAICDLTIRQIGGQVTMSVIGTRVAEGGSWDIIAEADRTRFDAIASGNISSDPKRCLIYHPERCAKFRAEDIKDRMSIRSPSTQRTLGRYSENLLPKAILHLFLVITGERTTLPRNNSDPWDTLNAWDVDAFGELVRLLHAT